MGMAVGVAARAGAVVRERGEAGEAAVGDGERWARLWGTTEKERERKGTSSGFCSWGWGWGCGCGCRGGWGWRFAERERGLACCSSREGEG